MPTTTEAFPLLTTPNSDKFAAFAGPSSANKSQTLRRRKSTGHGDKIRFGTTSAPAFATSDVRSPSPKSLKVQLALFSNPMTEAHTSQAQSDRDRKKPFSQRRRAKYLFWQGKRYALKHTWVAPLVILGVFLVFFAINPTQSNPIHHFIFLSYAVPKEPGSAPDTPIQYAKGRWDFAFVSFYITVLAFTREFIMQEILRPLARRSGLKSRGKQFRFMEQMYTAIYFAFIGPWGLYVMSRSPMWYFNTKGMYEGFPHKTMEGVFKFYYLFQAAYWSHQAIVILLRMEKPRKDFRQLVGHHVCSPLKHLFPNMTSADHGLHRS
jgi:acyl-CoA-dependent ceramide synthase